MLKCKYCGKEFDKKGLLLAHYRDHKKEQVDESDKDDEIEVTENGFDKDAEIEETQEKSIPVKWCPNAEYLGNNKIIGMRVMGIKRDDKIFITQIDLV